MYRIIVISQQPMANLIVCSEGNPSRAVKVLPKLTIKPVFGQKVSKWGEQLQKIDYEPFFYVLVYT